MSRLFVDNLTVIDFSYLDFQRGVVGESWIVDIELVGSLDEQGMVFDFGHIKKQIKQFIDTEVDHRLLVPTASTGCVTKFLSDHDNTLFVDFPLHSGGVISHQSPAGAVLLVDAKSIDIEIIASELQHRLKAILPNNVDQVFIRLRSEIIEGAYYHYTHGLQKHLGQCQRIAHGHRSKIEIQLDGERNLPLEVRWASHLRDIYIATEAHLVEDFQHQGILHTRLSYRAQQGDFVLSLPRDNIFIMPMESTVENIAAHLASLIAAEQKSNVLVKAYEGVEKGAFGEASV